ncbi:sensor histidine kinase [Nocardioides nematodiphilus]|uniref:sensor histidine kinase n=1 Tax=Nocardioides nematodiphilus TaxID=2849669 RepID=UPI001CDA2A69|nr:HAMP domain-containing sensor histidine kinase [Nocardioides nematodiphilus]MCA1981589.1 HAMP domain-containing histidine kinase [Nocardioides nematodiphilus]
MTAGDVWEIIWVAALCAVAVGAAGLALAWAIRRRSLTWHVLVVAAVAALGSYAGALAIARLMFLSSHDLLVMTVVSSVSAVVGILVALVVGRTVGVWSSGLREQVRALGPGATPVVPGQVPRELRVLSAELAEAQQRLEESRLRALRLEESRRELVSWVSHDLRTPLAGLRAMAEALEDGIAADPSRFHRQIRADVDRMAAMVDDLFELSRIHAGVFQLTPETVDVGDLVSEAIAGADVLAEGRSVRIGGRIDVGLQVTADPAGLSRVVSNLLINAIRHTPADGTVEISARTVPAGIELSVSDGCGGLDPGDMERVFDLGWRGSSARTPSTDLAGQSAGLGLAIVKGIVEAHRGRVEVHNLSGAAGCRFLVTLPV